MDIVLGLLVLFLLSVFGSGPIPLPVTAWTFWLGQYHIPALVVVVGTAGTALGWVVWRDMLKRLLAKRPEIIKKIPATYHKLYLSRTGLILFLSNASPLPFEPMRFLALINNYDPTKLLIFLTLGRIIRTITLVTVGEALAPYKTLFWVILLLLLISPLFVDWFSRRFHQNAAEEPPSP